MWVLIESFYLVKRLWSLKKYTTVTAAVLEKYSSHLCTNTANSSLSSITQPLKKNASKFLNISFSKEGISHTIHGWLLIRRLLWST